MGKKSASVSIEVTEAMRNAILEYMVAKKQTREEFCEATGYRAVGKSSPHSLSLSKFNHIMPEAAGTSQTAPASIKKTTAIQIANLLGISLEQFITGRRPEWQTIAEQHGWQIAGKLEGRPREAPNGISFLVKKVTHGETGRVGRGKFYCVSHFNMSDREQEQWKLNRHEIVASLTANLKSDKSNARRCENLSSRITAFSSGDDYVVIDEWVDGKELVTYAIGKAPGAAFIKATMKGIASGLATLHQNGVILRWLDPRGILVTDKGHATLVDFEFAKLSGNLLTVSPALDEFENSSYFSPQVAQRLDVSNDFSADVYSWACILARIVSGRKPGRDDSHPTELIKLARLPARIRSVAIQCLADDPGNRPANGDELLKAIRRW